MKVIISPAKNMNTETDFLDINSLPYFINDTKHLMEWIKALSFEEAKELWCCNDKIAKLNFNRFAYMDLESNLTPAIISYVGLQYRYMAPNVFTSEEFNYVQKHIYILSGFYGVLRPLDGVIPYRLEMQAKVKIDDYKNLYDFWSDKIYNRVIDESRIIINLASKEYSKCVEKYLSKKDTFITCVFGEYKGDKVVQKPAMAKMCRGEMVRFMAENELENYEDIKKFDRLGYSFISELSNENKYVFIRQ